MSSAVVTSLAIYPLKSAAAVPVHTLELDDRGAVHDRRWMLVDMVGRAITQREAPRLGGMVARPARSAPNALQLSFADAPSIDAVADGAAQRVRIWGDEVEAVDAGDAVARWCRDALELDCRLVRLADAATRPVAARFAGGIDVAHRHVGFTDGAPLHVVSEASLDALNQRLVSRGRAPIPMARFRPNIVVGGVDAHAEDSWGRVRIRDVTIGIGAPCKRCVVTTVDHARGSRFGDEPLRELAKYRIRDGTVVFGVNATHAAPGALAVGDDVQLLA